MLFSMSTVITTMQKKSVGNRQPDQPSSFSEEIPTVSFCDLLAHPELYKDRVVRVRAVYVANFEVFQPQNFTGYIRDGNGDQDAMARRYSISGRFSRPDPYSGSYDFSDPQSLNR